MTGMPEIVARLNLDTAGFAFDARDINDVSFYGIPCAVIQRAEEALVKP